MYTAPRWAAEQQPEEVDRHRLAHPAEPGRAGRSGADRDVRGHRSQRRDLGRGLPAAAADLRLRHQPLQQRERQPRLPAGRRRHRRRRERNRSALPDVEARAGAGGRQALGARLVRRAACPAQSTSTRFPLRRSSASKCCRTALRRSTAPTPSPAWSTSSRSRTSQGFEFETNQAAYDEGDGYTQDYNLSWGAKGDKTPHVPQRRLFAPGSRVLGRPRPVDAAWSSARQPCNFGGSSGMPQGRFIFLDPRGDVRTATASRTSSTSC